MIQAHLVKQFDNHPVHIHIIDGFPIPTANIKRRLVETVIGQLSSRFNIERNWARDVWHLTNRLWRKILSHTVAFCLNSSLGRVDINKLKNTQILTT